MLSKRENVMLLCVLVPSCTLYHYHYHIIWQFFRATKMFKSNDHQANVNVDIQKESFHTNATFSEAVFGLIEIYLYLM